MIRILRNSLVFPTHPAGCTALLVLAGVALLATSPRPVRGAGNTQFIVLNAQTLGSYEVLRNGAPIQSATASDQGTFPFVVTTALGETIVVRFTGIDPFPPSALQQFAASGRNDGCAVVQWQTPPASDYVSKYRVYRGPAPGSYTDSMTVDLGNVVLSGGTTFFTWCGLTAGRHYLAARPYNQFDLWGPRTGAAPADVTTGNAQGPPAPQNIAVTEPTAGCGRVTWSAVGDPTVTGYRVYAGTSTRVYTDSTDVANATSAQICNRPAGRSYFSVRSLTAGGLVSPFSQEVSQVMVGIDTDPPIVASHQPAPDATGVPIDASLFFLLYDSKAGVDISTLAVRVNGTSVTSQLATIGGPTAGYFVQGRPLAGFPPQSTVTIAVDIADLAGNVRNASWTFSTSDSVSVDNDAPVFVVVRPEQGADNVASTDSVVVRIQDAASGVDISSIQLRIDATPVPFSLTGTQASFRLAYRPAAGWTAGETVDVQFDACDRASTPNCAPTFVLGFTVMDAAFAALPNGAIVPDGFWADDPARPLEVRNLPIQWSVRIFDAAGVQVRRFRNNLSEGINWAWDFSNDGGQRVARALYLIRVVDESGQVRRSGRFLVQIDP